MKKKSEFLTKLVVYAVTDTKWRLVQPLIYYSKILKSKIVVSEGFETDFASVPRIPFIYSLYGDRAHSCATIHDFLYQKQWVSRWKADRIFLEAMGARKKPFYIRYPMWAGVRLGGWVAWKEHRKQLES